jgi:hypothetical protein
MTFPASRFACFLVVGITLALPGRAESFASSASSAGSASIGSLSDSFRDSSRSSTRTVAEGDYRIVDVAAGERADTLRLTMRPVARPDDDAAVIYVDVPRAALGERASARGDIVGVRQRPYGYELAWADTRVAFFLALSDDWRRELEPQPVHL